MKKSVLLCSIVCISFIGVFCIHCTPFKSRSESLRLELLKQERFQSARNVTRRIIRLPLEYSVPILSQTIATCANDTISLAALYAIEKVLRKKPDSSLMIQLSESLRSYVLDTQRDIFYRSHALELLISELQYGGVHSLLLPVCIEASIKNQEGGIPAVLQVYAQAHWLDTRACLQTLATVLIHPLVDIDIKQKMLMYMTNRIPSPFDTAINDFITPDNDNTDSTHADYHALGEYIISNREYINNENH